MTRPDGRVDRGRMWILGVVGLIAVALYVIWLVATGGLWGPEPGRQAGAEEGPAAGGALGGAAPAATKPATGPAATRPVRKWSPPRFKVAANERAAMASVIRMYGLKDPAILNAMRAVPRHEFVAPELRNIAHADRPLPIGYGQTISQPYIVAEMTRQLNLKPTSRVLEIGTGSGYQAAVLTELTPHVYTIEIVKPLAVGAAKRLKRLGYDVVKAKHADGYYGWPGEKPFDAIIVTCAAGQIPPPLIKQLAPGGRMIIPVGGRWTTQSLMLVEKLQDGSVRSRSLMAVRFVPFVRKDGSGK